MKRFFVLCTIVLSCSIIQAQSNIKGKIINQDSLPLEGANIYIPELNKGTISNKDGYYELRNLPNGEIKLQVSFIGHANRIQTIFISGFETIFNITLVASAIEAEEIVVTGGYNSTQHENAVKIDVLKLNLLENKTTQNFTKVLTQIPGVDMISKGTGVSKPVIRGLSMNDILVLNNGVRFENYQYSSHHPLGIDEFGIIDVEVIKGPASLLYGSDAIGGVINFIKEKPALPNTITGDYNMQLFSNSLGVTNNIGIKGASNKFFAGIRIGQKSNADYLQGGGDFVPNTRFQEYSMKSNAGYTSKIGTFKLFYDFNQQKLGLVEEEAVELLAIRGRNTEHFFQQFNIHLLSLQNKLFLGKTKVELNAAYQNTELIHFVEDNITEIQMKLGTLTYETKIYLPSNENSEYIFGILGTNQMNSNMKDREKLLPDATINNYSAFALLQHTFFKKLKFQTGIRYDYKLIETKNIGIPDDSLTYRPAIDKNYNSLSGSFGAIYTITEQILLRMNVASAYRTPNLAELTSKGLHETRYELGNASLLPENSYEADMGMHFHFNNLKFDIAGFYNKINNYIFISPTSDTISSGEIIYIYMQEDSYLYGGEAGLLIHPLKWLHFESTFSSVIGKQSSGRFLPFIPAHKLNFEFRVEKEKFIIFSQVFASMNSHTAFNQNKAAQDETATSGYTLFDCGIGGNIKTGKQTLSIALSINNILDKKYVDHLSTLKEVDLFNPGRNFTFSVRIPFELAFKT